MIVFSQYTVWTINVVPAEIVRRPPDFLTKSLANPDKIFKNNERKNVFKNFIWICQWFSKNIRRPPRRVSGGSPDNFHRENIAGSHGTLRTVGMSMWLFFHAWCHGVMSTPWICSLPHYLFTQNLYMKWGNYLNTLKFPEMGAKLRPWAPST